jgi:hypothetical protein
MAQSLRFDKNPTGITEDLICPNCGSGQGYDVLHMHQTGFSILDWNEDTIQYVQSSVDPDDEQCKIYRCTECGYLMKSRPTLTILHEGEGVELIPTRPHEVFQTHINDGSFDNKVMDQVGALMDGQIKALTQVLKEIRKQVGDEIVDEALAKVAWGMIKVKGLEKQFLARIDEEEALQKTQEEEID